MPYKLRFVQKFKVENSSEFLKLEKQFENFEKSVPNLPKTNRYMVLTGLHPTNTLIWECDFDTLENLNKIQAHLTSNEEHNDLFEQQSKYIIESYTEIYKPYDI